MEAGGRADAGGRQTLFERRALKGGLKFAYHIFGYPILTHTDLIQAITHIKTKCKVFVAPLPAPLRGNKKGVVAIMPNLIEVRLAYACIRNLTPPDSTETSRY